MSLLLTRALFLLWARAPRHEGSPHLPDICLRGSDEADGPTVGQYIIPVSAEVMLPDEKALVWIWRWISSSKRNRVMFR